MFHLALPKEQSVPLREQPIEIIIFFLKTLKINQKKSFTVRLPKLLS
jgi:hypothetical protein